MKSLALMAWGQVLVLIDLRVDGFDLVPDPLGWGMCVAAAVSLEGLHRGYVLAGWASMLGVVASLPDWVDPEASSGALGVVMLAVSTVLVVATCTAIITTAPSRARAARAVRASDLLLTALLVVMTLLAGQDAGGGSLPLVIVLAVFALYIWFLVLLFGASKLPRPVPSHSAAR